MSPLLKCKFSRIISFSTEFAFGFRSALSSKIFLFTFDIFFSSVSLGKQLEIRTVSIPSLKRSFAWVSISLDLCDSSVGTPSFSFPRAHSSALLELINAAVGIE